MGAEYKVRCTACDYNAEVTVGHGGESGVHFETFICGKCNVLFSLRTRAATKMTNVLLNKLMEHDAKATAEADVKPRCPFCRAKEVQPCGQDVACPKCGAEMEWEKTADFD